MIQRIQTVFLILVAALMMLFLFFPVWVKIDPNTNEYYKVFSTYLLHQPADGSGLKYIFIPYAISGGLSVLAIIIAIIEIFKYKNRLTQIKLGTLNSLIMTGSLVLMVYLTYAAQTELLPEIPDQYQAGLFMPAAAMIFNSLANRFIRKDEALVRSIDRIR